MDVSLLLADPLSDHMAAFCCQDKGTDCKSHRLVLFLLPPSTVNKDQQHVAELMWPSSSDAALREVSC